MDFNEILISIELRSSGGNLKPLQWTGFCSIYTIDSNNRFCVDFTFYKLFNWHAITIQNDPKRVGFNEFLSLSLALRSPGQIFKIVKMDYFFSINLSMEFSMESNKCMSQFYLLLYFIIFKYLVNMYSHSQMRRLYWNCILLTNSKTTLAWRIFKSAKIIWLCFSLIYYRL